MKILLASQKPFAASAVKEIRKIAEDAGHEFATLEKYASEAELIEAVKDADALIVRSDKVTAKVVEAADRLRIVVRAGAGYDNLDLEACSARGVVAMNTPGQNANAVAELAIAMARGGGIGVIHKNMSIEEQARQVAIQGKTLGIQAFGNVGRLVGAKAAALGMRVKAIDPFLSPAQISAGGAEPVADLKQLYSGCDYLSIHIPATPQTIGSIGYELISSMPEGAVLVNTARKEGIDEAGLERALEERPDLCYVTDVAPDNIARLKEKFGSRVFATPKKMGAQTLEANLNAGLAAARQICAFFKDGDTRFQLNR